MRYSRLALSVYVLVLLFAGACQPIQPVQPVSGTPEGDLPASQELFSYISLDQLDLSEEQAEQFEVYESDPTTADINIAQWQPVIAENAAGADAAPLNVNLPDGTSIPVQTVAIETRAPQDYTWYGSGANTQATLVVQNNEIVGTITASDMLYRVRPLGNGLQAVILVDQAAFPQDHPPAYEELEQEESSQADLLDQADVQDDSLRDDGSTLTVVVAFTPAAREQAGNIDALIQLAIDETNTSYTQSGVNLHLELVDTYALTYTESGNMVTDRDRFRIEDDGIMDEIHTHRNDGRADIAILITGNGNFCGIAADIMANVATAFAVVGQNCATGYYSFAHEIGHLQGVRHNPENDPTNTPFAYGHGFYDEESGQRDIMSYDCPGGCRRIQYWSSPNVIVNGVTLGTACCNDNVRVLNETAFTLANFLQQADTAVK